VHELQSRRDARYLADMPLDASERRSQGSAHIDTLRGMAAVAVLLGHSREFFFQSLTGAGLASTSQNTGVATSVATPPARITIGNEAVMIFFVLSGYLVGGSVVRSIRRNRWSWKEYLGKRLTRLWMVLLPALVLTVFLDYVGSRLFPESTGVYHSALILQPGMPDLSYALKPGIIVGNALFLQNILVPTLGTNSALWSLAAEFWYYLLFPLLALSCWRSATIRLRIPCAALAGLILCFVGLGVIELFPIWLLGAGISLLPLMLSNRTAARLSAILGPALPLLMILLRRLPLDARIAQVFVALYASLLIYVFSSLTSPAKRGLYPQIATVLSDLSYPLYLVHVPIVVLVCAAINRPWKMWSLSPRHLALVSAVDVLIVVVAYFFHFCFQRHTDFVRRRLIGPLRHQQHVPISRSVP